MTEPVLTVEQMRAAEQAAMDAGTSEWQLMRRAGEGAAGWVRRVAAGRPVTVLCGPGNNGGDGYVIAEWLRTRDGDVTVVAPTEPQSETAARARSEFAGEIVEDLPASAGGVLVDCLFGYGLSRPVEGVFARLLQKAHARHSYRIAIDLPSGVESDSGQWLGERRSHELTLALGGWKRAHFLMPARADMGIARLVPIGLELEGYDALASARPLIEAPAPDSHKYRRGLVAVVAGEMPGASLLSSRAAMGAGAGYVKLLTAHSHPCAPADLVTEDAPLDQALDDERIAAVLIGPGLGRGDKARERLRAALEAGHRAVLDADALYMLGPDLLDGVEPSRLVATPHEGELSKLCEAFGVTSQGKPERASRLRDVTGMTVLAKGPDNLLAPAGAGILFFPRGPSWLSVAGSGDVLAGIAAARLSIGGDLARAVEEAVWVQQEAARIAGPAFTAGALAEAIPSAVAQFL